MSSEAQILVLTAATDGVLLDLLAARGRPTLRAGSADDLPDAVDGVRAAAVLPDAAPGLVQAAGPLLRACHEAEVPLLGVGAAAAAMADVIGVDVSASEGHAPVVVTITDAAEEDPMMAPTPSGVEWVLRGVLRAAGDVDVLAVAGDDPVVAVSGRSYAVTLDPMISDSLLEELVEQELITPAARSFLRAHGAALLGRWVDLVVGRTDEEMPWGRRGPQPVPAPGLSLNPA